jgi:glycogen debranching enzyme
MARYAKYVESPLVAASSFPRMPPERAPVPGFAAARPLLPRPWWDGHPGAVACWDRAWELAFSNLRAPAPGSGFVANYIDTAFNGHLFMWDSSFILMFGRYGRRAFDFQRTLDNFYAQQHPDGFICREIDESDGSDCFDRFDPSATGPNLMPWAEWSHFRHTGDRARLAAVLPPLLAFYRWFKTWRTWPDGSYWATGWACGMDNQPRMPAGNVAECNHGHMSWIDTCLQQVLAARVLVAMNEAAGGPWPVADLEEEAGWLARLVNRRMWDERTGFYYDRWPDGTLSGVRTIGSFWALLAAAVPPGRLDRFVAHLEDPAGFRRPHRVPSLSADHPLYRPGGDYWRGSVWAPTNYMVMEGLRAAGRDSLAHEIALNHLENVVAVFVKTGTLWENYAPESQSPGEQSARDFVGWTGLAPIAVLLEHVFGLRPDAPRGRLYWDVRLLDEHGVERFPWGADAIVDLRCRRRTSTAEKPMIEAGATAPMTLVIRWDGGTETIRIGGA